MVRSSDYFVGSGQHVRWNRQVDLLRRLEVDHQLKLRGLLHRQIGGGCARAQPADSRIFFAGRASAGRQSAKTIAQSVRRMTFLLTSFLPRSLSALCPLLSALCSLLSALSHLITLSARASMLGGIVRPICLAVLRLMTSSNFVGCSTGRSAGLVPLKILST